MTLQPILNYAHSLMENVINDGDIAIDATCGNGHDTLFLTGLVGEKGYVYSFDIQEQAIIKTRERLKKTSSRRAGNSSSGLSRTIS